MPEQTCDLSLIISPNQETDNLPGLLLSTRRSLETLHITYEILVAGVETDEYGRRSLEEITHIPIFSDSKNYGDFIRAAIQKARGDWIITMDAGQVHQHEILSNLWNARTSAEIIIGSRYVQNGAAYMPVIRKTLSQFLNVIFSRGLDLHVRDISSAFRLYKSHIIKNVETESKDYDILQEVLVKILMRGFEIREIPIKYRSDDAAYWRIIQVGWAYLRTFLRLWKLRNSIGSADYDARAYNALMPPQRYWQRQRYQIITKLVNANRKEKCLDVGCGSSQMISALPYGSIALDILLQKLRYARRFGHPTVQGSIFDLPIPSQSFPCVICSQVIEHVPRANVLDELDRVLQPGGFLILGTPDYANWQWLVIEWLYKVLLPQAYADEHITHYTHQELIDELVTKRGYTLESASYILKGELILGLRKPL